MSRFPTDRKINIPQLVILIKHELGFSSNRYMHVKLFPSTSVIKVYFIVEVQTGMQFLFYVLIKYKLCETKTAKGT